MHLLIFFFTATIDISTETDDEEHGNNYDVTTEGIDVTVDVVEETTEAEATEAEQTTTVATTTTLPPTTGFFEHN